MPSAATQRLEILVAELVEASLEGRPLAAEIERRCLENPDLEEELRDRMSTHLWLEGLASREPRLLRPGQVFGDYRVERLLGEGGMGRVYLATQCSLEREVAIKIAAVPNDRARDRMQVEARALARVRHEGIASVLAFEWLGEHPALVIEYVRGCTLQQHLRRGRENDLQRVRRGAARLARALHACHEQGVLHRDVKPSNVLLDEKLEPRLTDFGLARLRGEPRITETHGGVGTPHYMAPELLAGGEPDERSDLWSLGITLWEWTVGRAPFRGHSREALYAAITRGAVPRVSQARPGVPRVLAEAIERCLRKRPEERPRSALEVAELLEGESARESQRNRLLPGGARLLKPIALASLVLFLLGLARALPAGDGASSDRGERRVDRDTANGSEIPLGTPRDPRWIVERVERLRAEARTERAHARFGAATSKLDEALELAPTNGDLVFERADATLRRIALANEPLAPALVTSLDEEFARALSLGHESHGAFMARAFLNLYLGLPHQEFLERARALPLDRETDAFHSSGVEGLLGNRERARELAEIALRADPGSVLPYAILADRTLPEDPAEAERVLSQGLRLHPEEVHLLARRAFVLGLQGRTEEAEGEFGKLIAERPLPSLVATYYDGFLLRAGRLEELNAFYDTLVAEEETPTWLLHQCAARMRIGRFDEAVEVLRRAVALAPADDLQTRVFRAILLAYDEHYTEALEALEDLRGEPAVYMPLGIAYALAQGFAPKRDRRAMAFFLTRIREIARAARVR